MTPDSKKSRRTIKLKPITKSPRASASTIPVQTPETGTAPVPKVAQTQNNNVQDTIKTNALPPTFQAQGGADPLAVTQPSNYQTAPVPDDEQFETPTGTQPLKRTPAVSTRTGTIIPKVEESFGGEHATPPAAPAASPVPVPVPQQGQQEDNTKTAAVDRDEIVKPQGTDQTAVDMPAVNIPSAQPAASASVKTIKLKPSSTPQPSSPTAVAGETAPQQTIKLTGGTTAPAASAEPQTATAKRTIKLSPGATSQPAKPDLTPSSPTVKHSLPSESGEVKPNAPTIQLKPTMAVPEGGKPADAGMEEVTETTEIKSKLTIKRQTAEAGDPTSTNTMMEGQLSPNQVMPAAMQEDAETSSSADEPSIIFTIAAALTLVLIGYLAFTLTGQFLNL